MYKSGVELEVSGVNMFAKAVYSSQHVWRRLRQHVLARSMRSFKLTTPVRVELQSDSPRRRRRRETLSAGP